MGGGTGGVMPGTVACASGWRHFIQNLAPCRFGVPHAEQVIIVGGGAAEGGVGAGGGVGDGGAGGGAVGGGVGDGGAGGGVGDGGGDGGAGGGVGAGGDGG